MLDGARCQIIGRSYEDAVSTASRCELAVICRQLCAEGMRAIVPFLFDPDQIIVRQVEVLQQMKHPNTLDDYRTVTRKARLNNRIELVKPIVEPAAVAVEKEVGLDSRHAELPADIPGEIALPGGVDAINRDEKTAPRAERGSNSVADLSVLLSLRKGRPDRGHAAARRWSGRQRG